MRSILLLLAMVAAVAAPLPADDVADFHRALHDRLGLPEPVIVRLLDAGTPREELPVVGLIATRAEVPPERIVELRRSGLTYVEVAERVGAGTDIFYVPFEDDPGPPYGKAWGHLKQGPEARRSAVVLTDDEVIALANVRLITDTYDVAPARVVELQRHGKDYVVIHRELAVAGSGGIAVAEGGDRVVVVEQGLTARAGFDMRGGDYSKIYLGSLGECQQTCADERQCRAYTYNTRDRMCYLKDRPTSYTPRSDTVSGEKSG
jgi:hypothetical protein